MTRLLFRFVVNLRRYDVVTGPEGPLGPQFHRWLPDGQGDAIVLDINGGELKLWFERTGFVRDGFIEFDPKRREVDPIIMVKQGVLNAGNLHGLLQMDGFSQTELSCLTENKVGDELYIHLGKKLLKVVRPAAEGLLATLRTNFGQYWIREFEPWDSRQQSLGSYFRGFHLQWSSDSGNTWTDFVPDKPMVVVRMAGGGSPSRFQEYVTEEDWKDLADAVREGYDPSLAAVTLARAHEYVDQGDLKHALIESVSALELALHEFLRGKLQGSTPILDSTTAFWEKPLQTQIAIVALIVGKASANDIEHTIKAIKMRNDVIHAGWNPSEDAKDELAGLLRTVAVLLSGPEFRFPSLHSGNVIMPEEQWKSIVS